MGKQREGERPRRGSGEKGLTPSSGRCVQGRFKEAMICFRKSAAVSDVPVEGFLAFYRAHDQFVYRIRSQALQRRALYARKTSYTKHLIPVSRQMWDKTHQPNRRRDNVVII
jgi:hypothetical protein